MLRDPTALQKYAVAVILVAVAFGLRYGLYGTLDNRLAFAFFTPATIIAAWYGGLGPGMLTALAGLLLGDYFFLPRDQIGEAERAAIGLYAMNVTLIVVLFAQVHSRLRDLEHELRKQGGGETGGSSPRA